MYEPFLGEVRAFAGSFAPRGWAVCNGQLLAIQQSVALFSLLGVTYGGDGVTTFGLPDLRGASPVGIGTGPGLTAVSPGDRLGSDSVVLTVAEMPMHTHAVVASEATGSTDNPSGATWARARRGRVAERLYGPAGAPVTMAPGAVGQEGASQPHQNMPPFLALTFCIALSGVYPSRP